MKENTAKKATCCHKCGRVHVKGTACKRPYLTGKDSCAVNEVQDLKEFFSKPLKEAELKLGVKYELPNGDTGYIMTQSSDDPKDWIFSDGFKKVPYLSVKKELKPLATQPGKYDGAFDLGLGKGHHIDERMDDVDNFAGSDPKAGSMIQGRGFDWDKNTVRSTFLKKERAQLMRDREQEAEHHIDEGPHQGKTEEELRSYIKGLMKDRSSAATKGQDGLVSGINKEIKQLAKELKKRETARKKVDVKEQVRGKISMNEIDRNDSVLMKMRAAKDKKPDFGKAYGDAVKTAYGNDKNAKKLAFLKKERAQLLRDMEQEAEPGGGPISNEYGAKLNRIDAAIIKLSGRKEMTYDQAIAEESTIAEASVPSNIKSFAKRKGVTALVNKVAGWAEKVGARISGGTAIGYNYSTLVLDMKYQEGEIRINTDNDTIKLYNTAVNSFPEFKKIYDEKNPIDKEKTNENVAQKVIGKIKEAKPGLWSNINAKQKRGEKPSHGNSDAYKSAVKAGKEINKLKEEEGVPHYTKDGKLYDGPTHKDASGKLMTGDTHTSKSEYLSHKEDLNEVEEESEIREYTTDYQRRREKEGDYQQPKKDRPAPKAKAPKNDYFAKRKAGVEESMSEEEWNMSKEEDRLQKLPIAQQQKIKQVIAMMKAEKKLKK